MVPPGRWSRCSFPVVHAGPTLPRRCDIRRLGDTGRHRGAPADDIDHPHYYAVHHRRTSDHGQPCRNAGAHLCSRRRRAGAAGATDAGPSVAGLHHVRRQYVGLRHQAVWRRHRDRHVSRASARGGHRQCSDRSVFGRSAWPAPRRMAAHGTGTRLTGAAGITSSSMNRRIRRLRHANRYELLDGAGSAPVGHPRSGIRSVHFITRTDDDAGAAVSPKAVRRMNEAEVWQAVDAHRRAVVAMLEGLTDEQWEEPSLCDEWTVRDVAGHLAWQQNIWTPATVLGILRARGNIDRAVRDIARRHATRPVEQLIAQIRRIIGTHRAMPSLTHVEFLIDILVHSQDICLTAALPARSPAGARRGRGHPALDEGHPASGSEESQDAAIRRHRHRLVGGAGAGGPRPDHRDPAPLLGTGGGGG